MIIGIFILLVMLSGGLWCSISERKEWNGGFCKENGYAWMYFDTDSSGANGYKAMDKTLWLSWNKGLDS